MNENEMVINGETWVKALDQRMASCNGLEYCIIRATHAGVFAGYVVKREGDVVTLKNTRRLWYWNGAATLSQMAMDGVKKPADCKFSMTTPNHLVLGVCEVIPATETARKSIEGVAIWKA